MNESKADTIISFIDKMRNEIIETTKELIRIPTVNPPGEYVKCSQYLAGRLRELGLDVRIVEYERDDINKQTSWDMDLPRPNVLGRLKGEVGKPVLHLSGHYDVVPEGSGWLTDPFDPVIKEGKLYGRGSSDMKGGISGILGFLKALKLSKLSLKGDITVSFTPDEESGGEAGAEYILKKNLVKGDFGIIAEPGGLPHPAESVKLGHKGVLWLEITTHGRSSHAARPFLGINAFEKMIKVYNALKALEPELAKRKMPYKSADEDVGYSTLMLGGTVKGGDKINRVPDKCTMTVDRRFIPEEKEEEVHNEIKEVLRKLKEEDTDLNYDIKHIRTFDACITPAEHKISKSLGKAITYVTGNKAEFLVSSGAMDTRFFVKAGIPTLSYGPGIMSVCHCPNEYVQVEDLITVPKVLAALAVDLLD